MEEYFLGESNETSELVQYFDEQHENGTEGDDKCLDSEDPTTGHLNKLKDKKVNGNSTTDFQDEALVQPSSLGERILSNPLPNPARQMLTSAMNSS